MRTLLICHAEAALDREGLARWLASFSTLAGIIVLSENKQRMTRRVRREIKRVGAMRFLDVMGFRLHYRLFAASADRAWERETLARLGERFPAIGNAPVLHTHSPNSAEAEAFVRAHAPDIIIARCKTLIKEAVFSLPRTGTFVMHPGVCPEYRNAHGCFWALANDDAERVGMTLLKIDRGVDTGPVYGYFSYPFDAARESHTRIQARVVLDNLDRIREKLIEIYRGEAAPVDTTGRGSATWGQPWLTKHLRLKRRARHKARATSAMRREIETQKEKS